MKQFYFIFFCLLFSNSLFAQYPGNGNDWLEYNKTYYKFEVSEDGIYQLNYDDLIAAGLTDSELIGANFQLFNNGEEVPIYVSTETSFSSTDFIEFLGRKNDGTTDTPLYSSPLQQPTDQRSLYGETAIYFLTLSANNNNLRITAINNDLTNLPAKEEYVMHTTVFIGGAIFNGYHRRLDGINVFSSMYDDCEGFVINPRHNPGQVRNLNFDTPQANNSVNVPLTLHFKAFPHTPNITPEGNLNYSILGQSFQDPVNNAFQVAEYEQSFTTSTTIGNETQLRIDNNTNSRLYRSEASLTYPRTLNFSTHSSFEIEANTIGSKYYELENVSGSADNLIVHDISSNERITQPIATLTPIRTSANSNNHFYFDAEISTPTFQSSTEFENYTSTGENLVVIYHPTLEAEINGENYIDKYISHKQTDAGGNWSVKKVNILQLQDQFIYGLTTHPASIKNFIQELKQEGNLPTHVFLIGKGWQYRTFQEIERPDNYIPTYGNPGSDNMLVADYGSAQMNVSLGRVAIRTSQDLENYINKVIEYETMMTQTSDADQTKDKLWRKQSIHLAGGGSGSAGQQLFLAYLNSYEQKLENPEYGGNVTTFKKTSSDPIETIENPSLDSLINNGVSIINFFGHSSPTAFEYNLQTPDNYTNDGKYPFMLTNGCYVGNLFAGNTLSYDYVTHERGSLTFMGPTQFGIAQGMHPFATNFYSSFANNNYGITIGEAISNGLNQLLDNPVYYVLYLTKQQMVFHGDPTLRIYPHEKPDYLVTTEDVQFIPNNITSETEFFDVNVIVSNIGKAQDEEVPVRVTRILPNGETEEQTQIFQNVYFQDTLSFTFQTNALTTAGLNTFNVEIDHDDTLDEITRANNDLINQVSRPVVSSTFSPVKPDNYAIISNAEQTLYAASQEFYTTEKQFTLEIDTTKNFNSPLLISETLTGFGGTMEWNPAINYLEDTVYYWRTKLNEENSTWSTSSFLFDSDYEYGWNQSHHQQYRENSFDNLFVNDNNQFEYGSFFRSISAQTAIPLLLTYEQIRYSVDGTNYDFLYFRCEESNLAVAIIDPNTGVPLMNERISGQDGLYNSIYCDNQIRRQFPYSTSTPEDRKDFMDMIDEVPDDYYILVYSHWPPNPTEYDWESDTDLYGYNIFDKLEEQGITQIQNLNDNAPFIAFFQKGNPDFEYKIDVIGADDQTILNESSQFPARYAFGSMFTKTVGPALSWDQFELDWESIDENSENEKVLYDIIGVSADGSETLLEEDRTELELDLSSISVDQYPYLKVNLYTEDPDNFTPPQINYWRIVHEEVPELAIDISEVIAEYPIVKSQGEPFNFNYDLINISSKDMSPILVEYTYSKANGEQEILQETYDELPAGERQTIDYELDTDCNCLVGNNLFFIDANPNFTQPELERFNNVGLVEFEVGSDDINPYLDVTFDGIHIINGDLVSDEPNIVISLTDENDYLALDNPDDFEIEVTHPDGSITTYTAESQEVTFYPANNDNLEEENKAVIEFNPAFVPGEYLMSVQARDASDNLSGENSYEVSFEVTAEDIITRVINYPNPFTTRTEFVANIVGDAPDQILIQIFAPDGKAVREIRSMPSEVSVSNGNNFYKLAEWDGTDNFGDPVGNGAYYYKVTLKRNGEIIEPHDNGSYSEYFHNGIGKLYILR